MYRYMYCTFTCTHCEYVDMCYFIMLQFVPLRNFLGRSGDDPNMVQARLAKEVLAEIPDQFLSYMKKHRIQPPQQRQAPQSVSGQVGEGAPQMPQPSAPPM